MWFALFCLVIILILKVLLDYRRPSKFPPGPRGLPFFGNIFDMKNLVKETRYYSVALHRLAEKYGPVTSIRLGLSAPQIVISGREAVVEMLSRAEFDGRPNGFFFRHRTGGVPRGVLFSDGKVWNDHRRFMLKALKNFGFGKNTMESMILEDATALTNIIAKLAKEGPINNLYYLTSVAVINNLWSFMTGMRFNLEDENPKLKEILDIMNDIIRESDVSGGIINHFPFLRHIIPGLTGLTEYNKRLQRITQFFMNAILEHKRNRTEEDFKDFIDVYLAEMEIQKLNPSLSSFDEFQLIHIVKDLFTAGVETTKSAIGFTIAFVAVHQNVQKKIHNELDEIICKDSLPSLANKKQLPYLCATLAEVLRMANIGPTTIPHRAMTDTNFLQFKIKKDYTLLANLKSIHMDENHWGDPHIFRPERFINDNGQFVEDSWLVPFGLGRRRCLGEMMAKNNMFLFVASLLQKFHFSLPDGDTKPSLEGIEGFTIAPPNISYIASPRNL